MLPRESSNQSSIVVGKEEGTWSPTLQYLKEKAMVQLMVLIELLSRAVVACRIRRIHKREYASLAAVLVQHMDAIRVSDRNSIAQGMHTPDINADGSGIATW